MIVRLLTVSRVIYMLNREKVERKRALFLIKGQSKYFSLFPSFLVIDCTESRESNLNLQLVDCFTMTYWSQQV